MQKTAQAIKDGTKDHTYHMWQDKRCGNRCTGLLCTVGRSDFAGKIGNDVKIQNNVSVYEGVTIEDGVFLGPSCVFTNDLTPRARYPKGKDNYLTTLIKEGASIGANATIVCGHTIGRYAMVAAGSVVTIDIPDFALVMGVPVHICGKVDEQGNIIERC